MDRPGWWAKGLLFENCSCQLLCRAHISFKQRCDGDTCRGHWAAHISEGRFGTIPLDDLNAVVIYDTPPNMYMGGWTERLYLDERADDRQRDALESIFSGRTGGPWETLGRFVATRLDTEVAPILFDDNGAEKRMAVPGVLDTTVVAIRGADRQSPATLSNLYNVIHGLVHTLARGTTQYRHHESAFSLDQTHGLYSDFSWTGDTAGVS